MGLVFEELIRRFAEQSNETAGEHFTPREVIRLMVDLLFIEDDDALRRAGVVRSLYDPACGTGGMLSVAEEYLRDLNPAAHLEVFGQELNDESYAICKADMMIKGQDPENIVPGNSFSQDGHSGKHFDYLLSNPPFDVEWKNVQATIDEEHETQGFSGRFGPGLPRISDGSTLFLLHMLSKMKPVKDGGSRLAIVFNGSPLFSGDADSGEPRASRSSRPSDGASTARSAITSRTGTSPAVASGFLPTTPNSRSGRWSSSWTSDTRDNDTVAAIVGAAVGALHGIDRLPKLWRDGLLGRTAEDDDGRVFALVEAARRAWGPRD